MVATRRYTTFVCTCIILYKCICMSVLRRFIANQRGSKREAREQQQLGGSEAIRRERHAEKKLYSDRKVNADKCE